MHAEDEHPDDEQSRALHGGHAEAGRDQGGDDGAAAYGCGGDAGHEAEPARLDHARCQQQHRDAEEEDEVRRRHVGEGAQRGGDVGVCQRHVGDGGAMALRRHQVEQGDHVGAGLDRARRSRLAHELGPLRPAGRRQHDEAGHDPPAQDVVGQLRPIGLHPDLQVGRVVHELEQAGGGMQEAHRLLGAPRQQAGHEDEEDGEDGGHEDEPTVTPGPAQVHPQDRDHGVTIRRTRIIARPPVTNAIRHRTANGPRTDEAGSCSSARRPNPTNAQPFGVPRLSTWRNSGSGAGWQQVAAQEGEDEADDQRGGERLLRRARRTR